MRRNSNVTAVRFLLMLLTSNLLVAMEVFQQIEESWSHLAGRQQLICLATNVHTMHNSNRHSHHHHHHRHRNSHNRSRNGYPIDLFGAGNDEFGPDHNNYPCFFETDKLHNETHLCSDSQFHCPIKVQYIPIAMTGFANASTQICHSLQALEDDRDYNNSDEAPVNLIIVGGSVTWGGLAGGCMKETCAELRSDGRCAVGIGAECAWVQSIMKYLQHRYKNTLNLVDLSWGGTTSCTLPHTLIQRLTSRNITLTSRDLLFYDYSVNDGIIVGLSKLPQCMEESIEKLVHYSADGLPPTIVLLELYPFKGVNFHVESPEADSYSHIYHEVARKFHLPIISYRDLFWHPLFREYLKQYPKLESVVRYKWADPASVDVHPPWVVHDIYADVIAGVLELTQQLCSSKQKQLLKESFVEDLWTKFRSTHTTTTTSDAVLVLLNEEAEMKITNAPYLSPEEISALPYGWNLYQDRLRKPGWIFEGKVAKTTNNKITNRPALTFRFVNDKNTINSNNNEVKYNGLATLEITHMQTYRNAGGFRVQVCNVFLSTWATQRSVVDTFILEHFTSLDVAVFKVDLNLKNCNPKKSGGGGGGLVEVKIYPENIYDQHWEARGTQKVKITSVRLTVPK
jgi:hypothetical protein